MPSEHPTSPLHVAAAQTRLTQSLGVPQARPLVHGAQREPPQSTSVSSASFTWFVHEVTLTKAPSPDAPSRRRSSVEASSGAARRSFVDGVASYILVVVVVAVYAAAQLYSMRRRQAAGLSAQAPVVLAVKVALMLAGGLFNIELKGTGLVALLSDGEPLRLNVAEAPTFVDPQAAIAWSGGVSTSLKTDVQAKSLIGLGSGESVQLGLSGEGWVLVQPSEGRQVITS